MLKKSVMALLVGVAMSSGLAFADAEDDATWIKQCIADNKAAASQIPEVVKKYCQCMNDKMSEDEMQSITQWEQEHPKEAESCVKKAVDG